MVTPAPLALLFHQPLHLGLGLIVILLLGDGIYRLLRQAGIMWPGQGPEAIGLRILLALAAVPWLCLVMDIVGITITRQSLGIAGLVTALAGILLDREHLLQRWIRLHPRRGAQQAARERTRAGRSAAHTIPATLRSPAALLLGLATASLVLFSLVHVGISSPRAYDALVGYDLVGKILSYEGKLRSSVFTHILYNPQCVYPPFTSTNQGFWYLFHPAIPRLWVPLLAAGFALTIWAYIRRWTSSPTAAGLGTFLMLTPPELAFHLTVGQTDLPSMVFVTLALLSMVAFLRGTGTVTQPALFMLFATTARTENILFAAALTVFGIVFGRQKRWRSLWILLPSAAFFLFWNLLFAKGLIGYDPGQHFRQGLEIDPRRMGEMFRLAGEIIAGREAFGELIWLILAVPLLWAIGLLGRQHGLFLNVEEGKLSGRLFLLLAVCFVFYMPFFYQWDPVLNPLWTMHHTFKRGFFRFVPALVIAFVASPPLLSLIRHCDPPTRATNAR